MRSLLTHFVKLTSAVLIKLGRSHSYLIDSFLEGRDFKLSSTKRFFRAVEKFQVKTRAGDLQHFRAWQDWLNMETKLHQKEVQLFGTLPNPYRDHNRAAPEKPHTVTILHRNTNLVKYRLHIYHYSHWVLSEMTTTTSFICMTIQTHTVL